MNEFRLEKGECLRHELFDFVGETLSGLIIVHVVENLTHTNSHNRAGIGCNMHGRFVLHFFHLTGNLHQTLKTYKLTIVSVLTWKIHSTELLVPLISTRRSAQFSALYSQFLMMSSMIASLASPVMVRLVEQ